jgi:two-component system chemotaxis response regulator CheY
MQIVTEGAEYHFLTFLEKLKINPSGWIACTFSFSKRINHDALTSRRAFLKTELAKMEEEAGKFLESVKKEASGRLSEAVLYLFADNDVLLLCRPQDEEEQAKARRLLESLSSRFEKDFCDYGFLTKELYVYQKLADHKLLTMKRMEAYAALADDGKVQSLEIRRKKREEPIVLIVEDDRFTTSYIGNFLREYDIVTARNGEEAILKYLEYAPDAVFLDIHLPGLDGHQTLQALKAADKEAFVVMLSVDTTKSNIVSASEHGAVSFLKKPFSRERVLNTLRLSPFIRESQGLLPIQGNH